MLPLEQQREYLELKKRLVLHEKRQREEAMAEKSEAVFSLSFYITPSQFFTLSFPSAFLSISSVPPSFLPPFLFAFPVVKLWRYKYYYIAQNFNLLLLFLWRCR